MSDIVISHLKPHHESDHDEVTDPEDWEEYDPASGSFASFVVAGSCAGVAEHLLMFPVDTYKTHLQFARGTAQPTSFMSFAKKEGFVRLWRGAPAVFMACIPSHAAYFTAYEYAKEAFGANKAGHHPVAAGASGILATILHDAVVTPMDVVKQRMQLGYYRNMIHALRTIASEEGLRSLWRSYPTTVFINMPYAAAVVATNETVRKLLTAEGKAPSMLTYLLSGAAAGAAAATVTCPLDVVKTRIQTSAIAPEPSGATPRSVTRDTIETSAARTDARSSSASSAVRSHSAHHPRLSLASWLPSFQQHLALFKTASVASAPTAGPFVVARQLWAEAGIAAFFKGLQARVITQTPSMAISWGTYELVKSMMRRDNAVVR